ncbi:hypothetical protein F443_08732 [Phytophthora nicotianae P1569]|uniref:Catalase immune-responsive domain-containing protein n=3 Tax=Phytophthora nicotianae TaxID=4792 RepID=V9F613_PHYNI|nr:hypothetical protein F443_08732 [Phytophthora nicotianae P1569]
MKKIGVLLPTRSQYFPNSVGGPTETASLHYYSYQGDHSVVDKFSTVDDDNFSQVGDFYRKTLDAAARERLTDNIAGSLVNASKPVTGYNTLSVPKLHEECPVTLEIPGTWYQGL